MSRYAKVQFIAWELHTGPVLAPGPGGAAGWYSGLCDPGCDGRTGLLGQCHDIEARLAFTADAVARAELLSDRSPGTLKLFMAPEWLFRGAGGAYLQQLVDGHGAAPPVALPAPYADGAGALLRGLRALAARPQFEHWLFVFGSAVGAAFPGFGADGRGVLDRSRPGTLSASVLVQRGGRAHGLHCHLARKRYPAGDAWLAWNAWSRLPPQEAQAPAVLAAQAPPEVLGVPLSEARFRIPTLEDADGAPLEFGLEPGLDHVRAGAHHTGRLRAAGHQVRIQLLPSCGVALEPDAVCLQPWRERLPSSYVFQCDGAARLTGAAGCHTRLGCVGQGGAGGHGATLLRLLEASGDGAHEGSALVAVAAELPTRFGAVSAARLWSNGRLGGAGKVRVIVPLAL